MPKMKTHRSSAKRLKVTGSGKLKRKRAFHSHILEKKNAKRKRRLAEDTMVSKADTKKYKRLLGG